MRFVCISCGAEYPIKPKWCGKCADIPHYTCSEFAEIEESPKELSSLELLAQAVLDGRVVICEIEVHQRKYATDRFRIVVERKDSPNGE